MKIQQRYPTGQSAPWFDLDTDDYIFHAVLRQGRLVSKPHRPIYVEAYDLATGSDDASFVFHMSVLEASRVADQFPAFLEMGLAGLWKLSSSGLVTFGGPLESTAEALRLQLVSEKSAEFVRTRYARQCAIE